MLKVKTDARYAACCKTYVRPQDLKTHRKKSGHYDHKQYIKTKTAMIDAITAKREEQQKLLPKVKWGDREAENQ